jgi:hypothetical protein
MIINEVHIIRHPVVESEDYAPISRNRYTPVSSQLALEWVKPPTRVGAHIIDANCLIEGQQNVSDAIDLSSRDPSSVVILE